MPLYVYRCAANHDTERLRKYAERDEPVECFTCHTPAKRIWSAHHQAGDGIYSHTPNIGCPQDFERKWEGAKQNAERVAAKLDRMHPFRGR